MDIDKKALRKEMNAEMAKLRKDIKYNKGMMEKHAEARRKYDEMERAHRMPWEEIHHLQSADERDRMSELKEQAVRVGHIQKTTLARDARKAKDAEVAVKNAEKELENLSRATVE